MKARKSKLWKRISIKHPKLAEDIVRATLGNSNAFTFKLESETYICREL